MYYEAKDKLIKEKFPNIKNGLVMYYYREGGPGRLCMLNYDGTVTPCGDNSGTTLQVDDNIILKQASIKVEE